MGCGASSQGGDSIQKRKMDEPELAGKAKFVSCPSMSVLVHPETKSRWLLIVFSPLTYRGLTFVARCAADGSLVARQALDADLVLEKEKFSIKPSWNIFFKCIANEVAKAAQESAGAKVEFHPTDGSLKLDIKVAVSGAAAKPDFYPVVLRPVEATKENVYALIMEPISIYFAKKNTDFVDRPDPVREKQLGDVEVKYIRHSASVTSCQRRIADASSSLALLRKQVAELQPRAMQKRAHLRLMKIFLAEKSLKPVAVHADACTGIPTGADCAVRSQSNNELVRGSCVTLPCLSHLDPDLHRGLRAGTIIFQTREAVSLPAVESVESDLASGAITPIALPVMIDDAATQSGQQTPPPSSRSALWAHLLAFDSTDFNSFSGAEFNRASDGHALYLASLFSLYRWGLLDNDDTTTTLTLTPAHAKNFLFVAEQLAGSNCSSSSSHFYTAEKHCETLHAVHWMLLHGGISHKLQLSKSDVLSALLSAVIADLDHPGVTNKFLSQSNSFLSTITAHRSPIEKHSLTVAWQLALVPSCTIPWKALISTVTQIVLSTDMQRHNDFMNEFSRRCGATADVGRLVSDRIMALSLVLKAANHWYYYAPSKAFAVWCDRYNAEVKEMEKRAIELTSKSPTTNRNAATLFNIVMNTTPKLFAVTTVTPMLERLNAISGKMKPLVDASNQNGASGGLFRK